MTPKHEYGYSFCEGVGAGGYGKWHIRKLTKLGRKLSGNIDTGSLCRFVRQSRGWDLTVPISDYHLNNNCCKQCAKLFSEEFDT